MFHLMPPPDLMNTSSSCIIKEEEPMAKSERRQFTQEFKRNAVNLIMEKGVPVRKVARDLIFIRISCINGGQWQSLCGGREKLKPEDAELKRLQKELEEVKEERDIF